MSYANYKWLGVERACDLLTFALLAASDPWRNQHRPVKKYAGMQSINKHVAVAVTKHTLCTRPERRTSPSARDTTTVALQYTAVNSGFDIVTLRVDFRESTDIRLHFPSDSTRAGHYTPTNTTDHTFEKPSHSLTFECKLYPFEQRVLVYAVKSAKQRAFVRVEYYLLSVDTPPMDTIVEHKTNTTTEIHQYQQRSRRVFNHLIKWKPLPCVPEEEIDRACAEVNRYCQHHGDIFVDASFPPTEASLYDLSTSEKLPDAEASVYALCTWRHLCDVLDSSWAFAKTRFHDSPSQNSEFYTSGLPLQDSFLCALSILDPQRDFWLGRWFPSLKLPLTMEKVMVVPVVLYDRSLVRRHVVIDFFLPAFPLGQGLLVPRNSSGEYFAMLLHKAYAKLKGSYAALTTIPTTDILKELTGFPWVCLYKTASGNDEAQQLRDQDRLRRHIHDVQWRCNRPGAHNSIKPPLIVVSFGKADGGYRAFSMTFPEDSGRCVSWIHVHDDHGYLGDFIRGGALGTETEVARDSTDVQLSWEQLFTLEPTVSSLSLGQQYERCLRRLFLEPNNSTVVMSFAISAATLSTVIFSVSYGSHFTVQDAVGQEGSQQTQVDMRLSLASVEKDFSLVSCTAESEDDVVIRGTSDRAGNGTGGRIITQQMEKTLSPGEYVLSLRVRQTITSDGSSGYVDPSESTNTDGADAALLTRDTVEANLQLLFDCLDCEVRQSLSTADLAAFMQLVEHISIVPHGYSDLRDFVARHGSVVKRKSGERALTLDDLREVYSSLAKSVTEACDTTAAKTEAASGNRSGQGCIRDLIWEDLNCVILSSEANDGESYAAEEKTIDGDESGDGGQDATKRKRVPSQLDRRAIAELVCCVHSDTPLLSVSTLPPS